MIARRPLCWIVLAYALGMGSAFILCELKIHFLLLFVALPCFSALIIPFWSLLRKRSNNDPASAARVLPVFTLLPVAAFLLGSMLFIAENSRVDPLAQYAVSPYNNVAEVAKPGEMPVTVGRVMKIAKVSNDRLRLTVRADGRNALLNLKDGPGKPSDLIGRRISFKGEVSIPSGARNPGCFDYRRYLLTQGIRVAVNCDAKDVQLTDMPVGGEVADGRPGPAADLIGGIYNSLCRVKYNFLEGAEACMGSEAYGIFAGMLFGDTSSMDDDVYAMFQENGIAHILSVSGLHAAMVYAFLFILFGRRRSLPVSMFTAFFLILYAFFSEFSPSVTRAVIMIVIHIIARLLYQRYDLLSGIAMSAAIILTLNPMQLLNAGFQLSFLAVTLLAFAMPLIDRFVGYRDSRSGRKLSFAEANRREATSGAAQLRIGVIKTILPIFVIQVGMAPLTAYYFNYFSFSALILNIPVVFLSGLIIPVGIMMFALSAAPVPDAGVFAEASRILFGVAARANEFMIEALMGLARLADDVPGGHIRVLRPPLFAVVIFYSLLFLLSSEGFRIMWAEKKFKVLAMAVAGIIAFTILVAAGPLGHRNNAAMVFVDVGQGDCLHIRTPGGKNYLIDGGGAENFNVGKKTLLPYLLNNGVTRLDGAFVTHLHRDHYGGIMELSREIPIDRLYTYEGNRIRAPDVVRDTGFSEEALIFLGRGDRIVLEDGIRIDVLYPPRFDDDTYRDMASEEADENRSSLLMRLSFHGISALMTGDLGKEGEEEILRSYLPPADILKVGHHGSRFSTSDDFLREVNPAAAVIQVGRNNFGHPTAETLGRLGDAGIPVFRNDIDGAVMLYASEGRMRFETMGP